MPKAQAVLRVWGHAAPGKFWFLGSLKRNFLHSSEMSFIIIIWSISEYISHTQFLPRYWLFMRTVLGPFGAARGFCLPRPQGYATTLSVLWIKTILLCKIKWILIALQILTILITHSFRLMYNQAIFMYLKFIQDNEIVKKFCFDVLTLFYSTLIK